MPAKITLSVVRGTLKGKSFEFDERTTCIIGRGEGCGLRVPNDTEHKVISRHHCLLDINPPVVRIRDFGSRNGTWVNGKKIGQRSKELLDGDSTPSMFPEHDLADGDEIRLSNTVFRVSIFAPVLCASCGVELSEQEKADPSFGRSCRACRQKVEAVENQPTSRQTMIEEDYICSKCGRDVTEDTWAQEQGKFICVQCHSDPMDLMRKMLNDAKTGEKKLAAINGYELVKELGRGGMGVVYLARNPRLGRRVALKMMLPQVSASESATERFLREVENTKTLRHPNVVEAYESGNAHGTFFLTLEYCEGRCVRNLMKSRGGRLPVKEAVGITLQVLRGLEYAHQAEIPNVQREDGRIGVGRGMVHRDLKPQNIFLARSGKQWMAKVGDYGLAKAFDQAGLSGLTCTGTVAGTPHFIPRQQVLEFRFAKPEVDVWATAASLYNMLTGTCPRDFQKGMDQWQVVLQTKAVPIRQRDPTIPPGLASVIDHALIDEPEIRIKSAAELNRALKGAM